MKKIEAIIRPHKLDDLHTALQEAGFAGISVCEIRGYGRQKGHTEIYRGSEYNLQFVPKVKIELICSDNAVDTAIAIIVENCKTGQIGDGKIFIYPVEDAIRIRTEESGDQAL